MNLLLNVQDPLGCTLLSAEYPTKSIHYTFYYLNNPPYISVNSFVSHCIIIDSFNDKFKSLKSILI